MENQGPSKQERKIDYILKMRVYDHFGVNDNSVVKLKSNPEVEHSVFGFEPTTQEPGYALILTPPEGENVKIASRDEIQEVINEGN